MPIILIIFFSPPHLHLSLWHSIQGGQNPILDSGTTAVNTRATSFFSLHTNLIPGLNDQPQKQGWRFSALFSLRSFESTSVSLKNTFTAALQTHSEPRVPLIAFCAGLGWRCISQASLVTSALTHITAQVFQRSSSFASLGQTTRFIWISAVLPVFNYLPHRRIIADSLAYLISHN